MPAIMLPAMEKFSTQAVVAVSGAVMALFVWLAEKKNAAWVDNFSIAGSMIAGMAAAVVLNGLL